MGLFSSTSSSSSTDIRDAYNTSVTNTLGANSLSLTFAQRTQGGGKTSGSKSDFSVGDVFNIGDAFKSQDVSNFVASLGANSSAAGNPSATQGGGESLFGKWLPWILGGVGVFLLVRYIRK